MTYHEVYDLSGLQLVHIVFPQGYMHGSGDCTGEAASALNNDTCSSIADHVLYVQVALVKHAREEDGLHALAKIFVPPKSRSRWKGWSLKRNSDPENNSFTEPPEPRMHETLKPSPTFKERRTLRR